VSPGKDTQFYQTLVCETRAGQADSVGQTIPLELIGEEPLLLRIDDKPYSMVMRTPGDEVSHAAGFCLGEGIVDTMDDFTAIGFNKDLAPNTVDIRLKPERQEKIQDLLEGNSFVGQTGCGICGKEMIQDLDTVLLPADNGFTVNINRVFECIDGLTKNQQYYERTRGSHAAILFDDQLDMVSFAEDVGRHNALDKAIGKAFADGKLSCANLLVLSSRISYELIQKAARANLPMIISNSRPTALAAQTGRALNMTLAFPARESELMIVCGENRIIRE